MQRRLSVFRTNIRIRKREIPQLPGTLPRIRQAATDTTSRQELEPVGPAFCCGGLVLDDAVGEEGGGVEGEVLLVADEAVVLAAVEALDVGVGVAEGDDVGGLVPGEGGGRIRVRGGEDEGEGGEEGEDEEHGGE